MSERRTVTALLVAHLQALGERLLQWLYPPRCGVCGQFCDGAICLGCQSQWQKVQHPYCRWCGKLFDPRAHSSPLCGVCLRGGYHFDGARSAVLYEGLGRETVLALKFRRKPHLAQPMGDAMAAVLKHAMDGEDGLLPIPWLCPNYLVPVPLHPQTQRQRGYNQAALLAEVVGRRLEVPIIADLLVQVRPMKPQSSLGERERWENVKGAFAVTDPERVKGQIFAVIDDVMTTGATLQECAKVLKQAGARYVYCLTFARTVWR